MPDPVCTSWGHNQQIQRHSDPGELYQYTLADHDRATDIAIRHWLVHSVHIHTDPGLIWIISCQLSAKLLSFSQWSVIKSEAHKVIFILAKQKHDTFFHSRTSIQAWMNKERLALQGYIMGKDAIPRKYCQSFKFLTGFWKQHISIEYRLLSLFIKSTLLILLS